MTYNNVSELKSILDKLKLTPKKTLGQNFLLQQSIVESILNASQANSDDTVLEIGPGPGFLTKNLVNTVKNVICLEIDSNWSDYLKKYFTKSPNIEIINTDALQYSPPPFPHKIIANIPYYITSPLIRHFLSTNHQNLSSMTLLVQKEVAQKICSQKGEHSILSLQTQAYGQPKIVQKVAPGNFYPAPSVESAILQIIPHSSPKISNYSAFEKIIKIAFSQKRKTLENTLHSYFQMEKKNFSELLTKHNISPLSRPQHLDFEEWQIMVDLFLEQKKSFSKQVASNS